jgi:hypothetical protein
MDRPIGIRAVILENDFTDEAGAKKWMEGMAKAGLLWHLDDDPETVADLRVDKMAFSEEELAIVKDRWNKLWSLEWKEYEGTENTGPWGYCDRLEEIGWECGPLCSLQLIAVYDAHKDKPEEELRAEVEEFIAKKRPN